MQMGSAPGKRIVVESEKVGTPDREGEILEVIEGEIGVRYRVRWDDGRETSFRPSAGSVRVLEAARGGKAAGAPRATTKPKPAAKNKAKRVAKTKNGKNGKKKK